MAVPAVHNIAYSIKRQQYPRLWQYQQYIYSIQYKAAAVPTLVAVPAVHSIQYKAAAVPTHVGVPAVQYKAEAVATHVVVPAVHTQPTE